MRYVCAKSRFDEEAHMYRIYISDCIRATLNNKSNPRYVDLINNDKKVETRTSDEIIKGIKGKLKGLQKGAD